MSSSSAGVPPTSRSASVPPASPIPLRAQRALGGLLILLGVCLSSSAPAQSKPATSPPPAKTQAPNKTKPAAPGPPAAASVKIIPSRYVDEEKFTDYVESLSAVFSMRLRATDPFGQLQDPNAKPVIKVSTVAKTTRRTAPLQATPFSDIIKLIKVTTIMPKEQRFLIGTRSIKQGDRLPLAFRGKTIRVEVASVSSQLIEFHNLENGESASLQLNLLPKGMSPGTRGITAPGMVPDRPDSPIELDSGNFSGEKNQNR